MLKLLVKSHIVLFIVLFLIYLIEKLTLSISFVESFTREKKDEGELRATTLAFSFCYFMFMLLMLLMLLVDVFSSSGLPNSFPLALWFYVIFVLTTLFYVCYYKFYSKKLT